MVVIRESESNLKLLYGDDFINEILTFSGVIGFGVEVEEGEVRVEFNPDRPDLFAFSLLKRSMDIYNRKKESKQEKIGLSKIGFVVEESALRLRPYIVTFQASGKRIGKHFRELIDFQEKLHQTVGKDRSKVSIGIHDLLRLTPPFHYSAFRATDVKFTTYDNTVSGSAEKILEEHQKGKEYGNLLPTKSEVLIIRDSKGEVLSMPPVINGRESAISEETSDFFIDIEGVDQISIRNVYFILVNYFRTIGFEVLGIKQNLGGINNLDEFDNRSNVFTKSEIARVIGLEIPEAELVSLLERMGYFPELAGNSINVKVPGQRIDVMGPVDIIEDIAKAYGYSNITNVKPTIDLAGREKFANTFFNKVRTIMLGLGFQEVMSFVVVSNSFYEDLKYSGSAEILNPKSLDFSVIRDRLYLGIMDFFRLNSRRNLPQKVFEIGSVLVGMEQHTNLCVAIENSSSNFSNIKQIMGSLAIRLGITELKIAPGNAESLISGRCGEISIGKAAIGIIGEMHPAVLDRFEIRNPVTMLEINLTQLNLILN